jgi:predicted transcriptional regulator
MSNLATHDFARMYGECILFWLLENASDGRQIDDHEMQEGTGLRDPEFQIGLNWLMQNNLLDREEERLH